MQLMQMVYANCIFHIYVTFDYGLVTTPSLWTTFQLLSACTRAKEQVSRRL